MKTIWKKWTALLLVLTLLLPLAACGKSQETEEENNDITVSDQLSGETLTAGDAADKVFSLAVDLEQDPEPHHHHQLAQPDGGRSGV